MLDWLCVLVSLKQIFDCDLSLFYNLQPFDVENLITHSVIEAFGVVGNSNPIWIDNKLLLTYFSATSEQGPLWGPLSYTLSFISIRKETICCDGFRRVGAPFFP